MSWTITSGATESPVYTIDPRARNPGTEGTYQVVQPDLIQVDAFIPQEWVYEPPLDNYIDNGNSRKIPLDASFTTGTTVFTQSSSEFKVRQTLNVDAYYFNIDPDGSQEAASKQTTVGQTREYEASVLANGHIPSGAIPYQTATATPSVDTVTITHPSQGVVVANIEMQVANPLVFGSSLAPIHYQATVTIDRSNPGQPRYTITGTNSEFPAYEIYINSQRIYQFDPIPEGYSPIDLFFYDQTFNNAGTLKQ
jgi:hypothetical protein